jgi:hypothetical protein
MSTHLYDLARHAQHRAHTYPKLRAMRRVPVPVGRAATIAHLVCIALFKPLGPRKIILD